MGKKREDRSSTPGFGATLGDALRRQGLVSSESDSTAAQATPDSAAPEPGADAALGATPAGSPLLGGCRKVVVRLERKGRGGKAVTLVQPLPALAVAPAEELARLLRRALGCGATVEGDAVAVQGDQRKRLPGLLEAQGARRVVRG